jgi:D-arginine dehydrogenase
MSPEYQKAQAELVSGHIAKQDIVITTALIPGGPAPRLISDAQVATMRPGSVIVDLAASAGGNVEGTVSGERVEKHGVTIVGAANLARSLAADASALFARNLYNFLSALWDKEQGRPVLPDDDEIVKAIRLTQGGNPDILVIGGGIAGLSAAAGLSEYARVTVLEAEEQVGYHSSGRSATMLHYALGDRLVRALTLASRPFFDQPPQGFTDVPLVRRVPVLVHAREDEREALNRLDAEISQFAQLERLDSAGVHALCPLLNEQAHYGIADLNALRLDPHAMLQGNLRRLRTRGGELHSGARIGVIERDGSAWRVKSDKAESWSAPILVNAAGSWADEVAKLAGVQPIGLEPKRRTIITFDAPPNTNLEHLPFTKTIHDELYFGAESGRLFASPMDETPSDPTDAQPDEYDVALAAYRMEERTTVEVRQIHSKWAGLRTFTDDKHPAVGFAPDAEGFFWLAGQGGFGLQTSPAIAAITTSLIARTAWSVADVSAEELSPDRFVRQPA